MSDEGNGQNTKGNTKRKLPDALAANLWQPGQSGNPGGRPKRKPITELYEQILADPEAVEELRHAIRKAIKTGQMAMVLQLREMTDRVEGKITQNIDANVNLNLSLSARMQRAQKRLANSKQPSD